MKAIAYMALLAISAVAMTEAIFGPEILMRNVYQGPPMPETRSDLELPDKWIDQRIDNFDPLNLATYKMRYLENDEFYTEPNGPIIIFLGGEWTIYKNNIVGGHPHDMAREFNASLFYTEHRYYGLSLPFDELTVENLRFLSVEQALADVAHFIIEIKKQPRYANSRIALVGRSYSATMAAWFRQLYPHLAVGSWASSAPVNAQVDFVEYKEVVGAAYFAHGSRNCHDGLQSAFADAERLIANNQLEEFRVLFGICEGFATEADISNAFGSFSGVLAGTVQYHLNDDIANACNEFAPTTGETHLAAFARYFRNQIGANSSHCLRNYKETVANYRNTSRYSSAVQSESRQWLYQTCTEFGWYQTSGSVHQPFGSSFPVEHYTQYCADVYTDELTYDTIHELIDRKNVQFGALNLDVRNVYFTHGLVDPWRTMGIQQDLNPSSPVDLIPGASHCNDVTSISEDDSPIMLAVKHRIRSLFAEWLGISDITTL